MPFPNIEQPGTVVLTGSLRLKKYDGRYEQALPGYQDPYVYQNSEGIFDDAKKPDPEYLSRMFTWLDRNGELYFIEALRDGEYVPVGDVTAKPENPPIAIWFAEYRGVGIGTTVMRWVIERLRELGYEKIIGSEVYKWNPHSLALHKKLGFTVTEETEKEYLLELNLR